MDIYNNGVFWCSFYSRSSFESLTSDRDWNDKIASRPKWRQTRLAYHNNISSSTGESDCIVRNLLLRTFKTLRDNQFGEHTYTSVMFQKSRIDVLTSFLPWTTRTVSWMLWTCITTFFGGVTRGHYCLSPGVVAESDCPRLRPPAPVIAGVTYVAHCLGSPNDQRDGWTWGVSEIICYNREKHLPNCPLHLRNIFTRASTCW